MRYFITLKIFQTGCMKGFDTMPGLLRKQCSVIILLITFTCGAQKNRNDVPIVKTLIVFFDGLRPDYITREAMPNLYAFKQTAGYGNRHHSVFPTVTRVNSSSYSTGSYPGTHGIMGNSVYFPKVSNSVLNTGEASDLNKIAASENGKLLTAISLGEILAKAGKKMMVFSSGSTGQALLQNHTVSSGMIINTDMILPVSKKDSIEKIIGTAPPDAKNNIARHKWITDAFLKVGLGNDAPLVSAIWYSDPDGAAHSNGIGSPEAMKSIRIVDEQFGRIISTLKEKNLTQSFNIIITTDHGFVTYTGKESLSDFLIKSGLKADAKSEDVVLAGGAVYVKDHDRKKIQAIVKALQLQEWVGAIFTKGSGPGEMRGSVEGTLSFESIHWDHPERSGDILVDVNWNDNKNAAGYAGSSFSKGVAGHGSLSPYEVHIGLLASGPSFKKSYISEVPTSNVDIVPTILHLYHMPVPAVMDGRVMEELLIEKPSGVIPAVKEEAIETSSGNYKLLLSRSIVGKHAYVNYSVVKHVKAD